jgi:uncharacterized protein YwqG
MKYYKINSVSQIGRTDGEYWTIRSELSLGAFQQQHYMSGIPRQEDIERLPIFVYSDYNLTDVLVSGNFYDAFFISDKLKKLLDDCNLALGQFYFFEKKNVQWRDQNHHYWWLQSVKPNAKNAYFNTSLDLFLFENGLGNSLFASERLKNALEVAEIKGFAFEEVEVTLFSKLLKKPIAATKPSVFNIEFDFKWRNPWQNELKRPKTTVDYAHKNEWYETIFPTYWQIENGSQQDVKARLFPLFDKNTRQSLVSEHFYGQYECEPIPSNPSKSRFFGQPFLPKGFAWPRTTKGHPLTFTAQINLADLPKNEELPSSGLLIFFLDVYGSSHSWPTQADRSKVVFFENIDDFVLTDFPEDLPLNKDFIPFDLNFKSYFDLPDNRWTELHDDEDLPEKQEYCSFLNEINDVHGLYSIGPKLLGWPRSVQGEVGLEAEMNHTYKDDWSLFESQKAKIFQDALSWRLLFEFQADTVGLGDQLTDPEVYFLIKKEDLEARNFENVALVMQGT